MVVRGDVVLALSASGETEEILALLATIKRLQVPLIAMTGDEICSLSVKPLDGVERRVHTGQQRSRRLWRRRRMWRLIVRLREEACSLGLAPTASTTTMLALGDALAVTLSEKRGFKEEDFANLHPGGKLGKRLARVESLMHSGEALPCVTPQTKMPDVIYEMSRKKLGVTAVVEGDTLVGVISDGDLRRLLEKRGKDVLDLTAGEAHDEESADDWGWRICRDGAGSDGREEDYFADGGRWGRESWKGLCICMICGARK